MTVVTCISKYEQDAGCGGLSWSSSGPASSESPGTLPQLVVLAPPPGGQGQVCRCSELPLGLLPVGRGDILAPQRRVLLPRPIAGEQSLAGKLEMQADSNTVRAQLGARLNHTHHPRDRELGAALTPNPCSRAGSPLTFSLGGGPSMLLLSSQGGPGRPRLGGLCLPARLPLPFSALAALAARQSHCPPGHTLYGVGGWIPGQAAFERSGFPVVSKTLQLSFCRDLEIANISFLKGQRPRFFGMLKKKKSKLC